LPEAAIPLHSWSARGLNYLSGVLMETLSLPQGANQMAVVPDKYLDMLQQKKAFANLATIRRTDRLR
jgi:hypothetical protein